MQGRRALLAAVASTVLVAGGLTACSSGGSGSADKTITYWASNQAPTLQEDEKTLKPELAKFTEQTGIEVELQVIGWNDLLNRIMSAVASGDAPDVVNIGNTWSASLQATGAFVELDEANMQKVGGAEKFLETSMSSTGAEGKTPTSVPLYGLAYGLFYNEQAFADAGVEEPPKTWEEFRRVAKKLTDPAEDRYGLTMAGASYTENAHFAFILGKQQGSDFFDGEKATFTAPGNVRGVQQYIDFLAEDEIATPSSAEHATTNDALADFTSGEAAMILAQNNTATGIKANGMKASEYGVAPMPMPAELPPGGQRINSHVAGINIAAFKGENEDEALQLINFLTSKDQQVTLNEQFGALPVTKEAAKAPEFQTPRNKVFVDVLANTSAPMPMIPNESQFETTVGNGMKDLIASAATGDEVTAADVEKALAEAQQKMQSGG